ncbi:hypothetical protein ACLOJK_026978 [Asimina triloba]
MSMSSNVSDIEPLNANSRFNPQEGGIKPLMLGKGKNSKIAPSFWMYQKAFQPELSIGSLLLYVISRLKWVNPVDALISMVQRLFPCVHGAFAVTSLPFACLSNSMNKPVPLRLDVSLPSLKEAKWSFERLIYLFNIQLERDISM